ncbi:MAG: aminopeptidase P family protein [Sedimentisphaerales bacterium]|nr:aminopeptidase P family protein [Sedimentisphaerales bacterium]
MTIAQIKTFVSARLRRCRRAMAQNQIDALIVVDPLNVRYLTGFSGDSSILVLTPNRKTLVTDSRFTEQLRQECPGLPIKVRTGPIVPAIAEVLQKANLIPAKPHTKSRKKLPHIAVEADAVTVTQFRAFNKAIGKSLKAQPGLVEDLRLCKDQYEIKQLQKAARIAEQAIQAAIQSLTPGITEQQLAARVNYEMMTRSASEPSFPTIAAFGPHAAQPHAVPAKQKLKNNHTILIDWGACYNGYRSDLTRCWATGRIPPAWIEAYKWLLEAQIAAIKAIKPGAALADIDRAARNNWPKGLPMFGHGTGHGIGLAVHESPNAAPNAQATLEPGMVITVEPGVYIPGKFGIRIEDDVLVTKNGAKLLTRLPKNLESAKLGI